MCAQGTCTMNGVSFYTSAARQNADIEAKEHVKVQAFAFGFVHENENMRCVPKVHVQ